MTNTTLTLTEATNKWRKLLKPPRELVEQFPIELSWTTDASNGRFGGDRGHCEKFKTVGAAILWAVTNLGFSPAKWETDENGELFGEFPEKDMTLKISSEF